MSTQNTRKCFLALIIVLVVAEHGALALPAIEVEFHFRDPRDQAAFDEDKEALTATMLPYNFMKHMNFKDPAAHRRAQALLRKKDATSEELMVGVSVASRNQDRALATKLAILAVERFGKQGPKNNPNFTYFYHLLVRDGGGDLSLQIRAARDFCKFASRVSPNEVLLLMEEALRAAKEAHDTESEAIFAREKEAALNRLYSMAEDPNAADIVTTVPWGVYRAQITNAAFPLAEHGFRALAAGDAKEALRAFTSARKAWESVEAMAEISGAHNNVFNGVSPVMVQILRGLVLAYSDLGDPFKAQKARMSLAAYMRTTVLPKLLEQLSLEAELGSSALPVIPSDILALQPFLLPANYPEDGTLAEALLGWKSVTAVYRRALNQRRAELSPADLHKVKQMEASDDVEAARTGSEYSLDRFLQGIFEKKRYANLSERGSQILERALADVSNRKISTDALRAVLPKEGALIEFLRFPYYEGHGVWQLRYGALVLTKEQAPEWVNLGPATLLDDLIIRHNARLLDDSDDEDADEDYVNTLKELSAAVWRPLAARIPKDATSVWISPDAGLGSVSFAALLDSQEHFVGESLNISYCVNGRDLIESRARFQAKTVVLFGLPDYEREGKGKYSGASPDVPIKSVLSVFSANRVRRTKEECDRIAERARGAGYQPTTRFGPAASESNLANVTSPGILHIATHGFYYSFTAMDAPTPRMSDNPHNASGVALAGANATVRAWSAGKVPSARDDGIVTALEASRLDLRKTELTVLSSCESGTGHQVSGIGVIGLRGAFYQAGTRNLLVALWRVGDEETVKFMVEFYNRLFQENNVQTAFNGTQRQFFTSARSEPKNLSKNIRKTVRYFGPFLLSATGSLAR